MTHIGDRAFKNCINLKYVDFSGYLEHIGVSAFEKCYSLDIHLVFPSTLTTIGDFAFLDCSSVRSVDLSDATKMETLGYAALENCRTVKKVVFGDAMTSTGEFAFWGCSALEEIVFGKSLTTINWGAFKETGVKIVEIPDYIQTIEDCAFQRCNELTKIVIPDGLTEIGDYSFSECYKIVDVTTPISVDYSRPLIGSDIIERVHFTPGTGEGACYENELYGGTDPYCASSPWYQSQETLTSITFSEGIESIGEFQFGSCTSIESLTFPSTLLYISDYSFNNCTGLKEVHFPDGLKSIGKKTFSGCSKLELLILPQSLGVLDSQAFDGCDSLKMIVFPAIERRVDPLAFGYKIFVDSDGQQIQPSIFTMSNKSFVANDGKMVMIENVFNIDGTYFTKSFTDGAIVQAFKYVGDDENLTLPSSIPVDGVNYDVKSIHDDFAKDNKVLTSINLPEGLESIGNNAFKGCSSLKELVLPSGLVSIGERAFENCMSLEHVVFPETLVSVHEKAFDGIDFYDENSEKIQVNADNLKGGNFVLIDGKLKRQ